MKSLINHMHESLRIGIDDKPEMLEPLTWNELRDIIEDRCNKQGAGTAKDPIDFNDIDVSNIDSFVYYGTPTNTSYGLFEDMEFQYINISDWDVSNIHTFSRMFRNCTHLQKIDLSSWKPTTAQYLNYMFMDCYELKEVNLSNWEASNIKEMKYMFESCGDLKKIIGMDDWNVNNDILGDRYRTNKMFDGTPMGIEPKWYSKIK